MVSDKAQHQAQKDKISLIVNPSEGIFEDRFRSDCKENQPLGSKTVLQMSRLLKISVRRNALLYARPSGLNMCETLGIAPRSVSAHHRQMLSRCLRTAKWPRPRKHASLLGCPRQAMLSSSSFVSCACSNEAACGTTFCT